jgi:hypothetical protein
MPKAQAFSRKPKPWDEGWTHLTITARLAVVGVRWIDGRSGLDRLPRAGEGGGWCGCGSCEGFEMSETTSELRPRFGQSGLGGQTPNADIETRLLASGNAATLQFGD